MVALDIEGSEYEVLNKMVDNGAINYIDMLYVEIHNLNNLGVTEETTDSLISKLKSSKVKFWVGEVESIVRDKRLPENPDQ